MNPIAIKTEKGGLKNGRNKWGDFKMVEMGVKLEAVFLPYAQSL